MQLLFREIALVKEFNKID